MYEGTMVARAFAAARCSAPKTAKGAAKHRLLKATTLSRPRARAISSLAAHSATKKIRTPAPHMAITVGEVSKNAARMVSCMWTAGITWRAPGTRFSRSIQLQTIQRRLGEHIFTEGAEDGDPASGVGLRPESFFKDEANPCAGESAQVVATFGRVESNIG